MTGRDALIYAIPFALPRCRTYFLVLVKAHNTDEARTGCPNLKRRDRCEPLCLASSANCANSREDR